MLVNLDPPVDSISNVISQFARMVETVFHRLIIAVSHGADETPARCDRTRRGFASARPGSYARSTEAVPEDCSRPDYPPPRGPPDPGSCQPRSRTGCTD